MCLVKKPTVPTSATADAQKDPAVIRNPILDGLLGDVSALRNGRNSLRIDLANPLAIPAPGPGGGSASPASSGGSGGGSPYAGSAIPGTSGGGRFSKTAGYN